MIEINKYLAVFPELGMKIFDSNALYKDFGISVNEIMFLSELMYFPFPENVPKIKNGKMQKARVQLDPICVALYDYYNGSKIGISRNLERENTIIKMNMAKSIFKKYCPKNYPHCF